MPRLYLAILLIICSFSTFGQGNLKQYLDAAQAQYDKGDYYYALEYYKQAMAIDSQSVETLWNVAETYKAYKDYRKAEYYYAKVYDREEARIYPNSLLNWGIMQKYNGKYSAALQTFKLCKKKYRKDKKGYLYKKSNQEVRSLVWIQSALKDSLDVNFWRLPEEVNTKNAEFGHGIRNNQLIFSSLRADSISAEEEVYAIDYKTKLYKSDFSDDAFQASEPLKDLFIENFNTGNGTFSLDGKRFYFSKCSEQAYNYTCKIMVAYFHDGKWSSIDSLGEIINEELANTTMPFIGEVNNEEILFFASNREGGKGGMDLYLSKIIDGNQYGKPVPIDAVNTMDNELSPWWNASNKRLYFSSSWHNGFGGQDVFYTELGSNFSQPINAGIPINSSANDIYYFEHGDTSYVSSNRIGVLYSKNPTCCSDIFAMAPKEKEAPPTAEETLADLNKRLPVTLYFHNDIPNPRSWDTTTTVNYIDSYHDYTAMLNRYKKEYGKGLNSIKQEEAELDIENFFIEYVDKGVADLQLFRDLLLKELDRGAKINITVKGFASPLAKTDYNVNLTKRRIASLVNYMREYDNGVFVKYLDNNAPNGGKVVFSQVPFGEYTANQLTSDNPNDVQNSVYSRSAAIERKIEIQSVSYLEDDKEFALVTSNPVKDVGRIEKGTIIKETFLVRNKSNETIQLEDLRVTSSTTNASFDKRTLLPGESTMVKVNVDTSNLNGFNVNDVYLRIEGNKQELRLYISYEILK